MITAAYHANLVISTTLFQDEVDGDDGCHGDVAGTNEMEHVFVSLTPRADTFGRPGTKLA